MAEISVQTVPITFPTPEGPWWCPHCARRPVGVYGPGPRTCGTCWTPMEIRTDAELLLAPAALERLWAAERAFEARILGLPEGL